MKKVLIGLLMLVVIAAAAPAVLAHPILDENKYFYEDIDMRVVTSDNIDNLYGIEFFERSNMILQLQCNTIVIGDTYFKIINKFLKNGGTIWVYDSSVAEKFGFIKSDFTSKTVQGRKIKTQYAHTDEYPAYLCKAYPAAESPVLKGVGNVMMNCIEVGNDTYSAVTKAFGDDNFYPLLKVGKDGPFVCAYRKWGKGKVIFIAGLNEKDFKNPMFVANLKEFSFDLSMPETKDDKNKNEQLKYKCAIAFVDKTSKAGYITNKNIEFFANNENKIYEFDKVSKIKFFQPDAQDEIYFKDGTMLKGVIMMQSVDFSPDGVYIEKYRKKDVVEISF